MSGNTFFTRVKLGDNGPNPVSVMTCLYIQIGIRGGVPSVTCIFFVFKEKKAAP